MHLERYVLSIVFCSWMYIKGLNFSYFVSFYGHHQLSSECLVKKIYISSLVALEKFKDEVMSKLSENIHILQVWGRKRYEKFIIHISRLQYQGHYSCTLFELNDFFLYWLPVQYVSGLKWFYVHKHFHHHVHCVNRTIGVCDLILATFLYYANVLCLALFYRLQLKKHNIKISLVPLIRNTAIQVRLIT